MLGRLTMLERERKGKPSWCEICIADEEAGGWDGTGSQLWSVCVQFEFKREGHVAYLSYGVAICSMSGLAVTICFALAGDHLSYAVCLLPSVLILSEDGEPASWLIIDSRRRVGDP